MNKKYFFLIASLLVVIFTTHSCGGTDNNTSTVSDEWIDFQNKVYNDMADSTDFTKLRCLTDNGFLYYKNINSFKPIEKEESTIEISPRISSEGYPTFGDSVQCRYLGWFYYKDTDGTRKKYYFDGTETSPPDYEYNLESGVLFNINANLTSGFLTMLQNMKAGQQVRVSIPYQLGYGISGNTDGKILGYTTLFFDIYLMRIYPKNPKQYPNVDLGENNQ